MCLFQMQEVTVFIDSYMTCITLSDFIPRSKCHQYVTMSDVPKILAMFYVIHEYSLLKAHENNQLQFLLLVLDFTVNKTETQ